MGVCGLFTQWDLLGSEICVDGAGAACASCCLFSFQIVGSGVIWGWVGRTGEAEFSSCWLGDRQLLTVVIPSTGRIGEGWGEIDCLQFCVSTFDSSIIGLGGVFKFSCALGAAACMFAALNRGGAILLLLVSLVVFCFA